jgi:quercetin dioxygenase-like cupin family protein
LSPLYPFQFIDKEYPMPAHNPGIRVNPSDETIPAGNTSVHFLVTGADSGDSVSVFEFTIAARTGLPVPHSHNGYEETLYGVEGRSTWAVNGDPIEIESGQALCIPRGAVHAFMDHRYVDAKLLAVISPGIPDPAYFCEMGKVFAAVKGGPRIGRRRQR